MPVPQRFPHCTGCGDAREPDLGKQSCHALNTECCMRPGNSSHRYCSAALQGWMQRWMKPGGPQELFWRGKQGGSRSWLLFPLLSTALFLPDWGQPGSGASCLCGGHCALTIPFSTGKVGSPRSLIPVGVSKRGIKEGYNACKRLGLVRSAWDKMGDFGGCTCCPQPGAPRVPSPHQARGCLLL